MRQNATISAFPAAMIQLVTTLIFQHVLMIIVMSRMCFVLHTVIRISVGEFSNAQITVQVFSLNFVTEL